MSVDLSKIDTAPGRLPVVGHVPALVRRPLAFLQSLRAQGDLVRIFLGPHPVYVATSAPVVRQVVVEHGSSFGRGRLFDKAKALVGNGLATSDGSFHRQQRRIMQPAFHRRRIAGYLDVMREQTVRLTDGWAAGQPMDLDKEMAELALTVTAKSLFRAELGQHAVAEVRRSLPVIVSGLLTRVLVPDFWSRLPTPGNRRFTTAQERLRTMVDDVIGPYREGGVDHNDLLSALIEARYEDTGEPMSAEQIRDEVITILLAGTETTASTLAWLFHELATHPDVEHALHAELDSVLGGRAVTLEDIAALPYVTRVVNEVLRLHTPLWFILRRTLAPLRLGEIDLPEGTDVLYSLAALHRDPSTFPDPMRFDPDRWLTEPAKSLPRSAFMPFSAGPHICIGADFAWTEMLVAVATIASQWRLVPVPGHPVREVAQATLRPSRLAMTVEARR